MYIYIYILKFPRGAYRALDSLHFSQLRPTWALANTAPAVLWPLWRSNTLHLPCPGHFGTRKAARKGSRSVLQCSLKHRRSFSTSHRQNVYCSLSTNHRNNPKWSPLRCATLRCLAPCPAMRQRAMQRHVRRTGVKKQKLAPVTSVTLDYVQQNTARGYARVHTSIYIYI